VLAHFTGKLTHLVTLHLKSFVYTFNNDERNFFRIGVCVNTRLWRIIHFWSTTLDENLH